MAAVPFNLLIEQGATYSVAFEWHEGTATGPLIPTTGYTPRMQIKTRPGGEVLATLGPGNGLTASGGIVTLRIGADVTATLPLDGVYDLELHNDGDPTEVVRLVQGLVMRKPEVTTA